MPKKAAAAFLVGAGLAMWVGCTSNSNLYVYGAIPAASEIVVYREDPDAGVLTAVAGSPLAAGPTVQSIVIHPSKKFLYAANAGESDVWLFKISSFGGLTESGARTIVGSAPTLLAMDSAGSYLYVANSGSTSISVFQINATTGALTAVGAPTSTGIAPLNMKLSPSGKVLYVTGSGVPEGYIEVFSVNAGVLTEIQILQPGSNPYGLAINPAGTYLYTANTGDNSISEFTINADGTLSSLASAIGETYFSPVALLIDNSGKYLYVANEGSSNIAGYAIGTGGGLSLLSDSPSNTGSQPDVIATDSTGNYLFVGNQSNPVIQSFSLAISTGTLTPVGSYKVAGTAASIAATP